MALRDAVSEAFPVPEPKKRGLISRILASIPDVLAAGAEGYAAGAGDHNFPEAAAARGFSTGFRRGQATEQEGRVRAVGEAFKRSPEYQTLTEQEKTLFDLDPITFLTSRQKAKRRTVVKLSEINPEIDPKLDREIEMDEEDLPTVVSTTRARKEAADMAKAVLGQREEESKARAEERKRALQEREDERGDKRVERFSKTVEDLGVPEAITQFRTLQNLLPAVGEDIPGIGVWDGNIPELLISQKGKDIRQAVQALANVKIKDRSGAAVTPQEFTRFLSEFGQGNFKTEQQLRNGLQQALKAYGERTRNAYAGFDKSVRSQYHENQGVDDYLTTLDSINFGSSFGGKNEGPKKIGRFEVVTEP